MKDEKSHAEQYGFTCSLIPFEQTLDGVTLGAPNVTGLVMPRRETPP
jgi:hypothetical protein